VKQPSMRHTNAMIYMMFTKNTKCK
jgi:hypothetical protein